MNAQLVRFKTRKAKPCFFCRRKTKLRVTYETKGVVLAQQCLCAVCLQTFGMMAQAQKMLAEEDDTLLPPLVVKESIAPLQDPVGADPAEEIDEVTAAGYADRAKKMS